MDESNGASRDDLEHLNALGIAYYVLTAISLPILCFFGLQIALGVGFFLQEGPTEGLSGQEGGLLVGFGTFLVLVLLVFPLLTFWTGRKLRRQEGRLFCLVMAGFTCFWFPIGTVVGVFSIIVLNRPGVRALFEAKAGGGGDRMEYPSRTVSER